MIRKQTITKTDNICTWKRDVIQIFSLENVECLNPIGTQVAVISLSKTLANISLGKQKYLKMIFDRVLLLCVKCKDIKKRHVSIQRSDKWKLHSEIGSI